MRIFNLIDRKLQALYSPDVSNSEEEALQKRKSHFYSLLFCLILHTVAFFFIREYHRELYMLTVTSILVCIVIIMTIGRRDIFYIDVCTTLLLITITPVLTFVSEKYLFFSIAGSWIIPSIILLMTQNHKLTFGSFIILVIIMRFYYKQVLINKIRISTVTDTIDYLDSQIDLLSLTGFFYFLSILNFNSILKSKSKVLLETQNGLKAALKQQEAFIYSFSHELRNPMSSLLGNLELATQEVKDKTVIKYLKTAQVCGDILLQLVNNILDTAKADLGNLEVSLIPTNLRETLEKIWTVSSEMIKRKRLKGSLIISKDIPYNLLLDPHRIIQALLNLIGNSVKFTEAGSIKVKVFWLGNKKMNDDCFEPIPYEDEGVYEKDDNIQPFLGWYLAKRDQSASCYDTLDLDKQKFGGVTNDNDTQLEHTSGVLKIIVTDTGCGMQEDQLGKLFLRFSQVNSDPNKRKIGTGLGLWITKQICEKMDGEIRVYSKENVGTTFIICINCEIPSTRSNQEQNGVDRGNSLRSENASGQENQNLRALFVDDNPANIPVNKKFLEKAGVDLVKITATGFSAAEEYKKQIEDNNTIDLIIMDLDIVSQDVKDACIRIRKFEEAAKKSRCSIMLIGSHIEEDEIDTCINIEGEIKANYCYRKPLFYKDLENFVIGVRNVKFRSRPAQKKFNQIVLNTEEELTMS